jgi:DNA-binding NarL/FixJ family response regulator
MPEPIIRVVLVDDHPALRVGLRIMLEQTPDIHVEAEAGASEEALAQVKALLPDVVVMDCQLPGMSGMEAAAEIRRLDLPVHVLALSAYTDDQIIQGMIQAGAVGYLLKDEAPAVVIEAVRAAARGEGRWSAAVASRLAAWAVRPPSPGPADDLTGREIEVMRLLARGWDNQRIGDELHISERTVRFHLRNIYDKIGAESRSQAVVWAVHRGLGQERP